MADVNRTLALRFWEEVVNGGKFDVLDEIVATDYVQHQADVLPGREGLKKFQVDARAAFPDQHATIEDILIDRDRVMTRTVIRGTHSGHFGRLPPSGKSITITVIDVWRVEGGQLKEHWGVLDNLSFMRQLGVIPLAKH